MSPLIVTRYPYTTLFRSVAGVQRQRARNLAYLGEVVAEVWRLAPGALEVAYFADQVEELATQLTRLERRLQRLETSA